MDNNNIEILYSCLKRNYQFVLTILLGIIGIAISIILIPKKRLSYGIISYTRLLTHKEFKDGKFKLYYDNKIIPNIDIVEIKLVNTGNRYISVEDYLEPLCFVIPEEYDILNYEIVESFPTNFNPSLHIEHNKITLHPVLFNSKDFFKLKLILSAPEKMQFTGDFIKTEYRIKGVKELLKLDTEIGPQIVYYIGWMILMIGFLLLFKNSNIVFTSWPRIVGIILIFIGFIIARYGLKILPPRL